MSSHSGLVGDDLAADLDRVASMIVGAQTIAISGHTSPDGDSLGSALGLGLALRERYPDKSVTCLLADDAPVPRIYRFLPHADELLSAVRYDASPDLFISVDCPILDRLADSSDVARRARTVISFDHHPARHEFAGVSLRCVDAAATAVLIEVFLYAADMTISSEVATCLLCGIVTDTGRFQYQNANSAAFFSASRLVACGAQPALIALEVYQSQRIEYLRLESLVMGRIKTVAGGKVAYSYAREVDLRRCGVSADECDGLVDVVRSVNGVEVCLFLRELDGDRGIRGNLRSKADIDVSGVADAFGGGGHAAAAGFTYHGSIKAGLSEILPLLLELVGADVSEMPASLRSGVSAKSR
ncbi:phosphoesterase RecJ domain protein [Coriobacterium glomerans PW2]|uniref:Phosphoesterase RecJ domain protein n=1 Tax=Coriobacterium glomerans (strain ATCC 49209 / DSM 20642 / JCM 10262 / PW2) TaxID=700015 RepID=F2N9P6_CORGP|nr:DHH family phosphoesterase [Coriobacterium glomerans]AEB07149.1 phosphoesterase RecJ domain protein [Coriobacterium glomerans PW2]